MPNPEALFLVLEGLIFLLFLLNGIFLIVNSKKMEEVLKKKYYSRWLEIHDSNGNANIGYHGYIWNGKDAEVEEVYGLKLKMRLGFILMFSPLALTGLNIALFTHLGLFSSGR